MSDAKALCYRLILQRARKKSSAPKGQAKMAANGDHQVIKFRPRGLPHPADRGWEHRQSAAQRAHPPEPDPLSQYETETEEPEDYRHRMIANAAAAIFAITLTAIGIWLAFTISDLRKTQDCVLVGRSNCASIQSHSPI
jgi:hypothetical protein